MTPLWNSIHQDIYSRPSPAVSQVEVKITTLNQLVTQRKMTKAIAVLMTLLGTALAQIDRTCIDIAFNSETNTLSGKCQPRDNSGYIPSELDLNDCFGYDGTNITVSRLRESSPIHTS
jgi:hypothetical protein